MSRDTLCFTILAAYAHDDPSVMHGKVFSEVNIPGRHWGRQGHVYQKGSAAPPATPTASTTDRSALPGWKSSAASQWALPSIAATFSTVLPRQLRKEMTL